MVAYASSRERIARHRNAQPESGLRAVVASLLDVNDPGYWDHLVDECCRLTRFPPEADATVADFGRLAGADGGMAPGPGFVRRGVVALIRVPRG
jgi:hypothetical protein